MRFEVLLTHDAVRDLEELYDYIATHDTAENAIYVLDAIEETIDSLATLPERGTHPKELISLGIRDYRQIYWKPYRLIYRIIEQRVYIYLITDGRRDMQELLARRLLNS